MVRQQQYISQLITQLDEHLQADQDFAGELYDLLQPYLITGMSRGTMVNQAWAGKDYARETVALEGSHQEGSDGFMQFYADEASIQELILELFYQKLK